MPRCSLSRLGFAASFILTSFVLNVAAQTVNICGRSQDVRDRILRNIPNQSNCATVTSDQLSAITELNFRIGDLRALQEGDFAGLTNLHKLDLGNMDLPSESIPANLFAGLSNLKILVMDNGALRTLPETIFAPLTSLENLALNQNPNLALPSNLFNGLSSLKRLDLWNANVRSSVSPDLFSSLSSLETLLLGSNGVGSLPANLFASLNSLKNMNLAFNSFSRLPDDFLADLPKLEFLDLQFNELTRLPADLFDGITGVLEVNLNQNPINCLPQKILDLIDRGKIIITAARGDPINVSACAIPLVTLVLSEDRISEDGGSTTVTASVDITSDEETEVTVTVTPNSPARESDYMLSDNVTLTIAADALTSTGEVTITAVNNNDYTGNKTVRVGGTAMNSLGIINPDNVNLTIVEDEPIPTITLSVVPDEVREDDDPMSVTVTAMLNAAQKTDTEVRVSVESGTATAGVDFERVSPLFMTIVAGETVSFSQGFRFVPIQDTDVDEGDETVQLIPASPIQINTPATLTILDVPPPSVVSLELDEERISENGGRALVTATLSPASTAVTTVEVSVTPVSPATEGDYVPLTTTKLTIAVGETSSTGAVTITAVDNDVDAPDKMLRVRGEATSVESVVSPPPRELTIEDDDQATEVTLTISPEEVLEDAGSVPITVTAELDVLRGEDTEVNVSLADGTANVGDDFTAVPTFTITIPGGESEASETFRFMPTNDNVDEPDETVQVTGTTPVDGLAVAPAEVTILDATEMPIVTLALAQPMIEENGGSTTVTAHLDAASSTPTEITVSVMPNAPATPADYNLSTNRTLTIPPEAIESTGLVTITARDNNIDAMDKTVRVQGRAMNAQPVTDPADETLTITDDDDVSEITLSVLPEEVNEEDGPTTVRVTASIENPRAEATTVTITVRSGTATSGEDFAAVNSFPLTIPISATSEMGAFTLNPTPDEIHERDETILITGSSALGTDSQTLLYLRDRNSPPQVTLNLSPPSISENGGSSTVRASLSASSSEPTEIIISADPIFPATDEDYLPIVDHILTIPALATASEGGVTITAVDNAIDAPDKRVTLRGSAMNDLDVTGPSERTLTITDDDNLSGIQLTVTPSSNVSEDGGTTQITVTATWEVARSEDTQVTIALESGTAILGVDFAPVDPFPLTILANATNGTARFEFTPLPDDLHEPEETIHVTGSSPLVPVEPGTLTLFDSDLTPEVILELVPSVIEEDGGESRISARLTGKSSEATVITVLASHDLPVTEEDYVLSPARTLTIAAGEFTSTGAVMITAAGNAIDAPDKRVTVSGTATNQNGVTGPADQALTIMDDDEATGITLAVNPTEVDEDAESVPITVTATLEGAQRSTPTEVTIMVEDATATAGEDYEAVESFELMIPANASEGTGTFTFVPTADETHEPEETVHVTGRSSLGAAAPALLTITDTNDIPEVTLVLDPESIQENAESSSVRAHLNVASSEVTVVTISAAAIPPARESDYRLIEPTTLAIEAGEMESAGAVTITAVDNVVFSSEPKKVTVSGQASNPLEVKDPEDKELTITDNEDPPTFTLEVDPPVVNEGEGPQSVKVSVILNAPRATETIVTITVADGSAVAGEDYTAVPASIDMGIAPDQTTGEGMFALTLRDDALYEPDETIILTGTSSELGTVETSLTIEDNDDLIQLAIQDTTVAEEVGMARVRITVTPAAPADLTVHYQTADGSATEGADYTGVEKVLTIEEGSEEAFIEIPILGDDLSEEDETFRIQLSDPTGAVLGRDQATVTIEDDDVYRLRVEDASAQERDPEMIFKVTLDPPNPAQRVSVRYETLDGTAIADVDYMSQSGELEFMPNQPSREVKVPLVPDDDQEEMDKYFFLQLSDPTHAVVDNEQVRGTILDDDGLPVVNITPVVSVGEGDGMVRVEVSLTDPIPDQTVSVDFRVTEESAKPAQDYEVQTRTPLRFSSGQRVQFIEITINDDELFEGDETFRIALTNAMHGRRGESTSRVTIEDNERPVTVRMEGVTVDESAMEAVLPVILSGKDGRVRTFNYQTEDGSAVAGEDYTAGMATVTIPAGELRREIRVPILDDEIPEPTETFRVVLQGGEDIPEVSAQVTILDNEGALTVDLDDARASEGDGAILLPIRLSRPSLQAVMVEFASSDGSATEGSDYVSSKGIVIFEAGSTNGKIRIQILEDTEEEPEETFAVTLSNARHAALGKGTGIGTIVDNDGGSNVSVQSVTVSRSAAIFEMNLSKPSTLPVLVSYATEDGTALAGEDYEPTAGQVTFAPSEVSKTIDVKLLSGERIWEAKTFALVVLSAVNAEVAQARTEAVMEEESEESIQNAYVARVLRTWASQLVDALSRRMEGMAQCQIPDLTWLRDGRARWSLGEIFRGCGAEFTQGGWSVWGQGAYSRMRGQDGALSLRSDVTTMLLGADYAWDQGWMAGLVAAQSWDQGTYETPARAGTASSRLTGFYPYVSYQTGAGMRAWMLLGLGRGESELEALETELDAALVALGLTGTLTGSTTGRLGYEVDAFWATADMETGTDLGVRRVRAGVEGSLRLGAGMEPYLETALRQDGGDAETGLGIELGGGMRWSASQLRAEVGGRTLVLHTDEGLREWGLMGSVEYGTPGGLGPSMRVRPLWGNVYGGDLWREAPLHTMGVGSADQRVEMELGYGAPIQKSIGQSIVGMTVDPSGRAYRVGYNVRMRQGLQVSVATTARTMEANEAPPSYGLSARMDLKW